MVITPFLTGDGGPPCSYEEVFLVPICWWGGSHPVTHSQLRSGCMDRSRSPKMGLFSYVSWVHVRMMFIVI